MEVGVFKLFLSLVTPLLTFGVACAEQPKIRVALLAPLSGPVAFLGEPIRKGCTLAHERLAPDIRSQIDFVVKDDQFDTKQSLSSYRQLESSNRLDVLLVTGSPPANALAPIVEKKDQILVAIAASDPTIVQGRAKSFIHWVIPPQLATPLVDELLRRDFARIALVASEVSGAIADIEAVKSDLTKRGEGARVVYEATFGREVLDFKGALSAMKGRKVDVVVAVLFPPAVSAFAKQLRQLLPGVGLVGMETLEDSSEVTAAQGALEGAWYANAADATGGFAELYKERWGELPGIASGNGYDVIQMLGAAVAAGNVKVTEIARYLRGIQGFKGAAGDYGASGDNRFTLPPALKMIKEGKFVPYSFPSAGPK